MFKPSIDFILTVPRQCFSCGSFLLFMFHVCLYYTVGSVPCSLVITCWERLDLLALLYVTFPSVLPLSHMVSRVRCGTCFNRFLIFVFFVTNTHVRIFIVLTNIEKLIYFQISKFVFIWSLYCCAVLCVLTIFAIIPLGKIERAWSLTFIVFWMLCCYYFFICLILTVSSFGRWFVIVAFPDHTHLLFAMFCKHASICPREQS